MGMLDSDIIKKTELYSNQNNRQKLRKMKNIFTLGIFFSERMQRLFKVKIYVLCIKLIFPKNK